MLTKPDGIALFSGGLDSLLSTLLLKDQGLHLLCLHFTSPFFGNPDKIAKWRELYNLDIREVDISADFSKLLLNWPEYGPGKTLNPCIDCKIIMLRKAKSILAQTGAKFIATGEVIGQRPMSQRHESVNLILKKTGLHGLLLRTLSARLLPPTQAEMDGIVNRDKLLRIEGRGRNQQLELAARFGIDEIPTPGGGCKLTERENARRYWPLLQRYWQNPQFGSPEDLASDFHLTSLGRVFFHSHHPAWLCIGRKKYDNDQIVKAMRPRDILLRLPFPGPFGLLRPGEPPSSILQEAAQLLTWHSPRAKAQQVQIPVRTFINNKPHVINALPGLPPNWELPSWENTHDSIRQERKKRLAQPSARKPA